MYDQINTLDHRKACEHVDDFGRLLENIRSTGNFDFNALIPLDPGGIDRLGDLPSPSDSEEREILNKLAVCKLNGGLGTTMGLNGPKSAIEIVDGKSFLDLVIEQVKHANSLAGSNIPLVLMNSFYTDEDTKRIIEKYEGQATVKTFSQRKFLRLKKDTLTPLDPIDYGIQSYYPPGHGDIYECIHQAGLLDELIQSGKEYLFISNSDNLGATVDTRIPLFMKANGIDFMAECAKKNRLDSKGGSYVREPNGNLKLLELAQVDKEHRKAFRNINRFGNFNTNNIWVHLPTLKNIIEQGELKPDYLINEKNLGDTTVFQIEAAMGSVINSFSNGKLLLVERNRFLPVKKVDDLFLMKSNLFRFEHGKPLIIESRDYSNLPFIRLGEFYATVPQLEENMEWMPDIEELDFLTLVGNIRFRRQVKLGGNVLIVCNGRRLDVPENSRIENQTILGALEIEEI